MLNTETSMNIANDQNCNGPFSVCLKKMVREDRGFIVLIDRIILTHFSSSDFPSKLYYVEDTDSTNDTSYPCIAINE